MSPKLKELRCLVRNRLGHCRGGRERGAKVVLAARSARTLRQIADRLNGDGAEAFAVTCDVADRTQVEQLGVSGQTRGTPQKE